MSDICPDTIGTKISDPRIRMLSLKLWHKRPRRILWFKIFARLDLE